MASEVLTPEIPSVEPRTDAPQEPTRALEPRAREAERTFDLTLRPKRLADFVGQEHARENLDVFIAAAKLRGEPIEHALFYGPPGLGKTTLAHIIACEMGSDIRTTSGPALERVGDIAAVLTGMEPGGILFIDEIHRLNRTIEEVLYPAMEDFALDIIIGKGPSARTVRLDLPRFTLIGATTRLSLISAPLRDRFGATYRLDLYSPEEITRVLARSATILGVTLPADASTLIAARSRGTPRIANRLLKRVRDFAAVRAGGIIDGETANAALDMLEIDSLGLDSADRHLLEALIRKFDGGPAGLQTLAAATGEDIDTIELVHEPYLMRIGFLARTPRGRMATEHAYRHLGIAAAARQTAVGTV